MAAKERRRRPVDAADVLSGRAQLDPRHQRRQVLERAVGGNRRQHVVADHPLRLRALHVHDRRLAGDGDRLGDRADLQVLVDRRHERPRQFNPFPSHGPEPGEREGDRRTCRAAGSRSGSGPCRR